MKLLPPLALAFCIPLLGCGRGVPSILGGGVCDGYPAQESSPYVLPFAPGTTHRVGQGNCATSSHYGNGRYAYDITMDIGTDIVASRGGVVTRVLESNADNNGCGQGNANKVGVLHEDGTYAEYVHLTQDGVLVEPGDTVTQGQVIAKSGNTGCSTGPHLHFQVWSKEGSGAETIPVTFRNTQAHPNGLQGGNNYSAE